MPLPKFRFQVVGKELAHNLRGQEMRRLTLRAVPSQAFLADDPLPEGMPAPEPVGLIQVLVSVQFAQHWDIGDLYDLPAREVAGS